MGNNENSPIPCTWEECGNNPDWFKAGCINQKVNIWKLCKKKHITPVQLFMSCPYCGRKINLKTIRNDKDE